MNAVALPASPCTHRCSVDRRRRICTGCFRTLDEIAAWRGSPAESFVPKGLLDAYCERRRRTWGDA